jgi:hypothetical protein
MKQYVETEIKLDNGVKKKYTGRFLGFVTEEEYRLLIGNAEVTSRIETKTTKSLLKCCDTMNEKNWGLNGIRFVMVIRKSNSINILQKVLLVSDKLNYISEIKPDEKEVTFVTMRGDYVAMKEREGKAE